MFQKYCRKLFFKYSCHDTKIRHLKCDLQYLRYLLQCYLVDKSLLLQQNTKNKIGKCRKMLSLFLWVSAVIIKLKWKSCKKKNLLCRLLLLAFMNTCSRVSDKFLIIIWMEINFLWTLSTRAIRKDRKHNETYVNFLFNAIFLAFFPLHLFVY